jgi:hypothetical protein
VLEKKGFAAITANPFCFFLPFSYLYCPTVASVLVPLGVLGSGRAVDGVLGAFCFLPTLSRLDAVAKPRAHGTLMASATDHMA